LEDEIRDYLVGELPSLTITVGDMPPATENVPTDLSTIYGQGGESEERFRFRIITRASDYLSCMTDAESIYSELQRLKRINLPTHHLYMVTGLKPQFTGRDESGNFLASSDYLAEFTLLP
jgi:hypothetical protein